MATRPEPRVRRGQEDVGLGRDEFRRRFAARFQDPAFEGLAHELEAAERVAWEAYSESRKSPRTRRAGARFADPDFELPVEWLETRARIHWPCSCSPNHALGQGWPYPRHGGDRRTPRSASRGGSSAR
jgi:hypothetical protein